MPRLPQHLAVGAKLEFIRSSRSRTLEAHGGPEGVARRRRELAAAIEAARPAVGCGVAKTEELVLEEVPA